MCAKEKGELVVIYEIMLTDDINNATDARIVNMAKAQLYDNSSKATVVKKKVVTAPKMVKAGQQATYKCTRQGTKRRWQSLKDKQ